MEYPLAKQLKDAGFPQKFMHGHVTIPPEERKHPEISIMRAPTLDELIEALGDGFKELTNHVEDEFGAKWMATPFPLDYSRSTFGSTRSEAVARLWLALQDPNH